jgi:acetoin utilization deacetylase AcuC-like enzyme
MSLYIGAAYALHVHRDVFKRVAIVDFDVHHGNGTEVCMTRMAGNTANCNCNCDLRTIGIMLYRCIGNYW